jgi:hypothetical protein
VIEQIGHELNGGSLHRGLAVDQFVEVGTQNGAGHPNGTFVGKVLCHRPGL